ncbi:glycosyl hydrolase catalytic core-domain-containing protein [Ilyonectria robusta]|uniref:glycosyl hydrolase catalytic core-domain-containing protein n=1 Tax=Ilyonectria robusta TaxID=1079257 RepID=UPI001E8E21E3|nr:glycosyl hydrolase catalytic core-domain-containing protein [Ilyonectria robusta]KAH8735142.1 glycosyl hydrolase catalytic core-domain-containing protein [Ilyonectria robusta]
MVANKVVLLTAAATLVESALGFNFHRHGHQHINKRALETEWVTEWVTVWVTPGREEAAAATSTSTTTTTTKAGSKDKAVGGGYDSVPTTTSTTVVVVPTSTSTSVAYVAPVQTTLTTAVLPKSSVQEAAVVTTSSVEQVAAVPETTSAVAVEEVATTSKAAAAATTSKKAAATTAASSSSSSAGLSHKRGLAYNDAALANTFGASCANCGWAYSWGSTNTGSEDLDSAYNFIPLLHSNKAEFTSVWADNAAAAIKSGSKALFSFNEPDIPSQANIPAADAAAYHVQYMNPFSGQAKIGAPSVSNSGESGQGLEWLSSWIDACEAQDEKCQYDFCNIHWYSQPAYVDTLFTQLEAAHKLCGKPIWLTEFAPIEASDAQVSAFLEEVIPKLEALDYVEAYSYFMVATGNLMSSATSLSSYGQVYASA